MLLEVIQGLSPGLRIELGEPVARIGRSPSNEVVLEDIVVSARHAQIVQGLDGATLEDLGSTNGTAVVREGERLSSSEPDDRIPLLAGDVIELGSGEQICRLRVVMPEPAKPTQLVSLKRVDDVVPVASRLENDPVTLRALYETQCSIGRAADLRGVLEGIADAVFRTAPM
jgi:pSer/pThr/pTyr-binding forkhead associated (FHA) protein